MKKCRHDVVFRHRAIDRRPENPGLAGASVSALGIRVFADGIDIETDVRTPLISVISASAVLASPLRAAGEYDRHVVLVTLGERGNEGVAGRLQRALMAGQDGLQGENSLVEGAGAHLD